MDRYMGEWLYYNFAAGSFNTKNFVADFIRLKLIFIQKQVLQQEAYHAIRPISTPKIRPCLGL